MRQPDSRGKPGISSSNLKMEAGLQTQGMTVMANTATGAQMGAISGKAWAAGCRQDE